MHINDDNVVDTNKYTQIIMKFQLQIVINE